MEEQCVPGFPKTISNIYLLRKLFSRCSHVRKCGKRWTPKVSDFVSVVMGFSGSSQMGRCTRDTPCSHSNFFRCRLKFFFDEFEVANALGTRAGIHKLGGVYWVIQNLPASLRSKLSQIFVVTLFHSEDVKTYGFEKILQPLVAELSHLETDGIAVSVKLESGQVEERIVKGSLSQICGDNLGMNQIFNMVASFTNTYFCRFCRIHSSEKNRCFREDPGQLRTVQTYDANVAAQAVNRATNNTEGIKGPCILNKIPSFHITRNYTVSIMHDIWHGVAKYVVLCVCDAFISAKCITEDELNSAVENFDYGHEEVKNKPTSFTRKKGKLKLKATFAECACICRLLPQILGGRLTEERMGDALNAWKVLLRFLDCSFIIFARSCTLAMVAALRAKVEWFLRSFVAYFPDRKVKPKMHFLVHYPRAIMEVGPLGNFSEMRFEANHHTMKTFGGFVCNFKNIGKTLALRHQLQQASLWLDGTPFERRATGLKRERDVAAGSTEDAHILGTIMELDLVIKSCLAVNFCGVQYRPKGVLVCGVHPDNLPIFNQILRIYVPTPSCVAFVCRRLITTGFTRHVYAYAVEPTDETVLITSMQPNSFEHHPVTLRLIANSQMFVSLRSAPEGVYIKLRL